MSSLTVIMPVRNGMPYLRSTLASLEAQTDRDWELLVRDDGSTDGTMEELRAWIPERLPGKILTGEPLGVGGSLRALVDASVSPLLARIDADDLALPERFAVQRAFLAKHPEIAVVGSKVHYIDDQGASLPPQFDYPTSDAEVRWSMRWFCAVCHPTVMMRREAVVAAGNYRRVVFEDIDLWLRIADRFGIVNLPERLLQYRIHPKSTTSQHSAQMLERLSEMARINEDLLFPGAKGEEALLLREKVARNSPVPVSWRDGFRFRELARKAEVAWNLRPGAVTESATFQSQAFQLRRNWILGSLRGLGIRIPVKS